MSSAQVKEQVNNICRLAHSLKDTESLCDAAEITVLEINSNIQNAQTLGPEDETEVIVDFSEIDRMQKENEEMKLLISDYHRGVELMMAAYRIRALNNVLEQNTEQVEEIYDVELLSAIHEQSDKIHEMRNIMQRAATAGDMAENAVAEQMAFLRKENATLRELYEISMRYGITQQSITMNIEDKSSQTDDDGQECSNTDDDDNDNDINDDVDDIDDDNDDDDDDDDDDVNNAYDDADVITVISFKLHDSDEDDEKVVLISKDNTDNNVENTVATISKQ